MNKKDKKNQGFTLTEIIVILIILAVLAAAAIPLLHGYIKHSRKKVCDIKTLEIARLIEHERIGMDNNQLPTAKECDSIMTDYGIPSNGGSSYVWENACLDKTTGASVGSYTVALKKDSETGRNKVIVICSYHADPIDGIYIPDGLVWEDLGSTLYDIYSQMIADNIIANSGRIDSNSNMTKANTMIAELLKNDITFISANIQSWAIIQEGSVATIWFSDQKLDDYEPGDKVRVIRYNPNSKKYTVAYQMIQKSAQGDYNVFVGKINSTDWIPQGAGVSDFATALETFNALTSPTYQK